MSAYAQGGTFEPDPRARSRRAPFRLYQVTLFMRAQDGTGYSAARVERAQDPDGASAQATDKELAVQRGRVLAGGQAHELVSVLRVRALPGRLS